MRIELSNLQMLVLGHTDYLVITKEVPLGIRLQLTGRGEVQACQPALFEIEMKINSMNKLWFCNQNYNLKVWACINYLGTSPYRSPTRDLKILTHN